MKSANNNQLMDVEFAKWWSATRCHRGQQRRVQWLLVRHDDADGCDSDTGGLD
jgi:hypothetical protein